MTIQSGSQSDIDKDELMAHYRRIIEISQQLSTTYDYASLLRKIVDAANELIHTEAAAILLFDEPSGKLRFEISSNIKQHEMEELLVPLDASIAGWIFTHGEPRVIQDISRENNHFQGVDNKIRFSTRNLLGVPMKTHDRVIGVVQAVNKHDDQAFTDIDVVTLRTLASQAATAIENARMFQQSDFMAEMVHELRTPLTALRVSTTLLQNPALTDDKRTAIVSTMKNETERLIRLTSDFLDVARLESGRTQLEVGFFDLNQLIDESIEIVDQQANSRSITISTQYGASMAEGDRGKIKQVLLNLLTNAIKYNRESGQITVTTRIADDPEYVEVAVEDTGYGISREHQMNMFQKFYRVPTTEHIARGTGLGLTICKHIVEAHSGRIWLESVENQGSTFLFTIPLADVTN